MSAMSAQLKPLNHDGDVDPLFPAGGKAYLSPNGFYLNEVHGGKISMEWLEKNFEAKEDDTYVISYPKTGTTWVQEIVYVIGNDLDFQKAKSMELSMRFPYMEISFAIQNNVISTLKSPRFLKSHYPYSLLPQSIKDKKCKMIIPVRNPKDTLVSFYHFAKMNPVICYQGDFETFFNLFIKDERIVYSPFWKHILEYWEVRHQDNILIVHYEDLKQDANKEIRRIAEFLGKTLTDEQVEQVKNHCSFDSMKSNEATNYKTFMTKGDFMRKGEVGDWETHFTEDMNKKMDEYVNKHFKSSGFEFKYRI